MTDNLASFDDQLSQRFIALDPSGYFLISVDLEAQELVAEHYSNNLDDQGRATDPETGEVLNCDDVSPRKPSVVVRGRTAKEIGIHTVRAGDIIGEHRVLFGGMGENFEIFHRAQSRQTFARGSIRAAQWILNQPKGVYDMQDVLGLT